VNIRFLTSTPLDIRRGSGTYVGIHVLGRALEDLGHTISYETPRRHLPIFTAERLLFNREIRPDPRYDLTVGFDMDGYRVAARDATHVASLKGVIADEIRFERGLTRLTMSLQARCERLHVQRAARVLTTCRYSADRVRELYSLRCLPSVVPEPIRLAEWRSLLAQHPAASDRFPVLFVGRFYRRKRVDVLLRAAAILRHRLPALELRIVGNGPCAPALHALARDLKLDAAVTWLGDITRAELAAEYNRAAVFCLPSVQEGFGIVLLEAMAAGKPIVAARAAAIPEVAPHAALFDPDDPEALAAALADVQPQPSASRWVEQFDAPIVAARFLAAATGDCATCVSVGS
jgi:glycosyltransferase involved in cell wall biosynthesis